MIEAQSIWTWLLRCWAVRRKVLALSDQLSYANDANHLLKIELEETKKKLAAHMEEHKVAKDGNRALLRFIHTRHRLNVKFDPGTIRESLQRADQ